MTKASKLLGFFDFFGNWDPSLIAVCVSALLSNTILYHAEIKQLQQVDKKNLIMGQHGVYPTQNQLIIILLLVQHYSDVVGDFMVCVQVPLYSI